MPSASVDLLLLCVSVALLFMRIGATDCNASSFPSNVANANTPGPDIYDGTTTTYTCSLGYEGTPSATCNGGVWSTNGATCTSIIDYCTSSPAPANTATGSGASALVYTTSSYTCSPGYQTDGPTNTPYTQCLPSGNSTGTGVWASPAYQCLPFDNYCSTAAPASIANANTPTPLTQVGAITSFTCNFGYISSSSPSAPSYTCTTIVGAGAWNPLAVTDTCNTIPAYCIAAAALTLVNASLSTTSTTVNTQNTFTCNPGYQSSGIAAVSGTTVPYYLCLTGTALAGAWPSATTYTCPATPNYCNPLPPAPAVPTLTQANTPTPLQTIGSSTYFTCNYGYVSSAGTGAANLPYYQCVANTAAAGQWTPVTNTCIQINPYCPVATAPTLNNANTPTPVATVYGQTSFTCNWGYQTDGNVAPFYSCLPQSATAGQWSGVSYTCQKIPTYCAVDPSVNSKTNLLTAPDAYFQTTIGATVTLVCVSGAEYHTGSGSLAVTCQMSGATTGTWSGSIGYCDLVPTSPTTTPASWTTMPWQPTWWFWLLVALVAVLLTLILAGLAALFTYYCFLRSGRQSESLTRIQLHQNSAVESGRENELRQNN